MLSRRDSPRPATPGSGRYKRLGWAVTLLGGLRTPAWGARLPQPPRAILAFRPAGKNQGCRKHRGIKMERVLPPGAGRLGMGLVAEAPFGQSHRSQVVCTSPAKELELQDLVSVSSLPAGLTLDKAPSPSSPHQERPRAGGFPSGRAVLDTLRGISHCVGQGRCGECEAEAPGGCPGLGCGTPLTCASSWKLRDTEDRTSRLSWLRGTGHWGSEGCPAPPGRVQGLHSWAEGCLGDTLGSRRAPLHGVSTTRPGNKKTLPGVCS